MKKNDLKELISIWSSCDAIKGEWADEFDYSNDVWTRLGIKELLEIQSDEDLKKILEEADSDFKLNTLEIKNSIFGKEKDKENPRDRVKDWFLFRAPKTLIDEYPDFYVIE